MIPIDKRNEALRRKNTRLLGQMLAGDEKAIAKALAVSERKPAIKRFVMLRRYGDIINLLPLLYRIGPVELVVHKQFASILDGVSYVKPIVWNGGTEDALRAAKDLRAVNAQTTGAGIAFNRERDHFAKSAWTKLGHPWDGYAPLVFDKRDYVREHALAGRVFKTDKPKVLINLRSLSIPYDDTSAKWLVEQLTDAFGDIAELVMLNEVRAERIYDLLGLMDRADCMVTVDTATLWLAAASTIPVIALVNNDPAYASPHHGNCIERIEYRNVQASLPRIIEHISNAIASHQNVDTQIHVYRHYQPDNAATVLRDCTARATWRNALNQPAPYENNGRSSADIGDARAIPYVRDMIEHATLFLGDVVVISNNDISADTELHTTIRESCRRYGCYWAYRVDRKGGMPDAGCDLFAFTRKWWRLHQHQFPDLLFGYRWWDNIMRRLMRWSGCPEGERLYYHSPHPGVETRLESPGEKYNCQLAEQWRAQYGEPLADDGKLYAKPVVWVFAICWNEREMIEYFLRHYETFADKIIIFDENSTDGTREVILGCRKAELLPWPHKGLDDVKFLEAVNSVYKEARGHADWVIWADVDELLYHPDPLKALASTKGDVVPAVGYALVAKDGIPKLPRQIYELVRTGVRQPNYDKQIIWRPKLNLEHAIGRHTDMPDWPHHDGILSRDVSFKLLHCHHIGGVSGTSERNQRNYDRAPDKKWAWNYEPAMDNPKQVGTNAWIRDAIDNNKLVDVMGL